MNRLLQVDTGYACFGIVVTDGVVTEAAPIAKWAVGKTLTEVTAHFSRKSAQVREVADGGIS